MRHRRAGRVAGIAGWVVTLALFVGARGARAADLTLTVKDGGDAGPGTLRQALADAEPGDRIVFADNLSEIQLTSGALLVTKDVAIAGPGASKLRITRAVTAHPFGIFLVEHTQPSLTFTLSGLTITGGADEFFGGGAIAAYGRGVHLALDDCDVTGNLSPGAGGIALVGDGQATLEMRNTTIAGNSSTFGLGGGLYALDARVTINSSTISGNTGGGIYVSASNLTLYASTLSNNHGESLPGGTAVLAENRSTVLFDATTVAGNQLQPILVDGSFSGQPTLRFRNSIFQAPPGTRTSNDRFAESLGHNLFSDSPESAIDSDLGGADARLGPLAFNGGRTRTHALLAGSRAIDTGHCADSAGHLMTVDQRGQPRPVERCDMGAFEVADEHGSVLEAVSGLGARLDAAVNTLASQASVKAVQQTLDGLSLSGLASQTSVDGVRAVADQANVQLSARLDEKVSTRSSQASVDTRASQASVDLWRADEGRVAIERQLADGAALVSFFLPVSAGGRIESVREVVGESIRRAEAARLPVRNAQDFLDTANRRLANGKYRGAWSAYVQAYQALGGGR